MRGVLLAAGVVVAVSLLSGLGFGWLSTSVFSTPGKVRLAITPATALGWTVARVVPVGARGLESAFGIVAFLVAVGLSLAPPVACVSIAPGPGAVPGHRPARRRRGRPGRLALVSQLGPRAARGLLPACRPSACSRWRPRASALASRRTASSPFRSTPRRCSSCCTSAWRRRSWSDAPATRARCAPGPAARARRVLMATPGRELRPVRARERPSTGAAPSLGCGRRRRARPGSRSCSACISLTTRSLWLDEAATVAIASQHGSALWSAIAHDGGNMLGYYALLHVLVGWFGHRRVRDPPAVGGGGGGLRRRGGAARPAPVRPASVRSRRGCWPRSACRSCSGVRTRAATPR